MAITPITTNTLSGHGTPAKGRPGRSPFAWTKNDSNYLEDPDFPGSQVYSRGVMVDTEGTYSITVLATDGTTERNVSVYLAANIIHPIECIKVRSTGSAAGNVVIFV